MRANVSVAGDIATYNFAYLDEQTKRMIRRAILKGIAIPGYQVPFASREMPMPYGWGTGGVQVTASIIGPDDVLKVIDQGADDTTNAVSIRAFFKKVANVAVTTETGQATIIQTRHRIPEAPLKGGQTIVFQVPIPEPLRFLEPRETETRKMHALEEYGLMHVKLYEDIARHGRIATTYDYPVKVEGRYVMDPSPTPKFDNPEDAPVAGPATVRRRPREAHLRGAALHRSGQPRLRGPPVRGADICRTLRAVRSQERLSRRGRARRPRRPHVRLLRHRPLRDAPGRGHVGDGGHDCVRAPPSGLPRHLPLKGGDRLCSEPSASIARRSRNRPPLADGRSPCGGDVRQDRGGRQGERSPSRARPMTDEPLLRVNGVSKFYGARVGCENVTFDLWPGEVLAVVGESGSGKTTLLNCLSTRLAPTSGTVSYRMRDGAFRDLYRMSEAERRFLMRTDWGFVHQNPADGLRMTVSAGANVGERLMAIGDRHYGKIRDTAIDWLGRVEISDDRIDDEPRAFSGGMRQRLQIARNLVTGPRLVFMDEPTGGLDVSVQARLLDLLRGLVADLGLAAIVVTHDLAVARLLSQRMMVMKDGRVIETGLTDRVLDDPREPYTQLLVSSILQV